MPDHKIIEESNEKSRKIFRFGLIALLVMAVNATLDFIHKLPISGFSVLLMALLLIVIMIFIYKGKTKGIVGAIVFTLNPILVFVAFAEGLRTGGYLFILPLLFVLGFLMSNSNVIFAEAALYVFITVISFCICIIFCGETSTWQTIPLQLANQMFTSNCIIVVCLCAVFAYIGIYFEKQYRSELLQAKNKAEEQEQKIKGQNKHLQDIAFMNAHILRSPLTNILALTDLIDAEKITDKHNKEMIEYLQTSAQQMDDAIKEIVSMATTSGK